MTVYRGRFAAPFAGEWEIAIPDDAGDGVEVRGCPGSPARGWRIVGETAHTLQLTNRLPPDSGAAPLVYDIVLNKASGRLAISVNRRPCPAGETLVVYGDPPDR